MSHKSKINQQYVQRKMEEKLTNYEWFDRFCNNREKFYYQSNNTGDNENNKEILKKFNLD